MAHHQNGIAIVIKAFLPTGKSIDEQFQALNLVRTAHETGDYSSLLKAAKIDGVKTETKNRRVEDEPAATTESTAQDAPPEAGKAEGDADAAAKDETAVPKFLKSASAKKAA